MPVAKGGEGLAAGGAGVGLAEAGAGALDTELAELALVPMNDVEGSVTVSSAPVVICKHASRPKRAS